MSAVKDLIEMQLKCVIETYTKLKQTLPLEELKELEKFEQCQELLKKDSE